jgi:hypothetical protein
MLNNFPNDEAIISFVLIFHLPIWQECDHARI